MKPWPASVRCHRGDSFARSWSLLRLGRGFSLLELLVTVAIIMILVTIYWSPSNANRQLTLQNGCQKNLQKMYVALECYANEHGGQFPRDVGARNSEEALDVLVPRYTSDTSPFVCPGSKDKELPMGESFRKRKISYAYYMGRGLTNARQVLVSDRQVGTGAKAAGEAAFSPNGDPPGNNHHRFGGNFLFCDGHIQFSPANLRFPIDLVAGEVLLNP